MKTLLQVLLSLSILGGIIAVREANSRTKQALKLSEGWEANAHKWEDNAINAIIECKKAQDAFRELLTINDHWKSNYFYCIGLK